MQRGHLSAVVAVVVVDSLMGILVWLGEEQLVVLLLFRGLLQLLLDVSLMLLVPLRCNRH